jgi:hypothetical protein
MTAILALDLGERMGWALKQPGCAPICGSISLAAGLPKLGTVAQDGRRDLALWKWLLGWRAFNEYLYESNRVARGGAAIAAYGGYRAIVRLHATLHGATCIGVDLREVRKWLCGSRGASKLDAWRALADRGHRCESLAMDGHPAKPDHDAADALAILLWRLEHS